MAINYKWDCKTVDVKTIDGNEDTVFNVHWRLTGEDDSNNQKVQFIASLLTVQTQQVQ